MVDFRNFGARTGLSHILPEFNFLWFFVLLLLVVTSYFIMKSYGKKKAKNENFFTRIKVCHGLCLIFLFIWFVIQHSDESFTDLRLIFLLACWTNAVIMWIRNYKWLSVMEFVVIGIGGYWLDIYYLTFPFYSIAKLLSSFIVFLFELILYLPVEEVVKIRFLLFFWNSPCHSKIEVGGKRFHYTFIESKLVAVEDKSVAPAIYNTCVGLALKENFMQVNKTLNGIGKCHDWSVVATTLLSTHKYMTYSFMQYQRWSSWLILGLNLFFLCFNLGSFMTDLLLLLWSGVDIYNCMDNQLQEDYVRMRETLHLSPYLLVGRWIILFFVIFAMARIPPSLHFLPNYGYILFLIVGLICHLIFQLIMNWWVPNTNAEELNSTMMKKETSKNKQKRYRKIS